MSQEEKGDLHLRDHGLTPSVDAPKTEAPLRVGDPLYGFCGGYFGRDAWVDKHVEAVGTDWVVVRDEYGAAWFAAVDPEVLVKYRTPEQD